MGCGEKVGGEEEERLRQQFHPHHPAPVRLAELLPGRVPPPPIFMENASDAPLDVFVGRPLTPVPDLECTEGNNVTA